MTANRDVEARDLEAQDTATVTRHTRHAAGKAADRNSVRIRLPGLGVISLPPRQDLAYLAGVATLAALSVIEWPVAATLAAGHLLASTRGSKVLRDFGEALGER